MSGTAATTTTIARTGNAFVDGVMTGTRWADPIVYFSFPTSNTVYSYSTNTYLPNNFNTVSTAQQTAIRRALEGDASISGTLGFSVEGFTQLGLVENVIASSTVPEHIRIAETTSTLVNTARVSDFPGNYLTSEVDDNGDVWFGVAYAGSLSDLRTPQAGNYAWLTHIHELGHALGLKHGHNVGGTGGDTALPADRDSMEYSIMTYRSYVGDPLNGGYSNEQWGFAQTWMMADIAALQEMYGADYTTNAGDTVYSWNPGSGNTVVDGLISIAPGANRIFATIWDGGGIDTYDLSAYTTGVSVNLTPGEHSVFSSDQLASLGDSNYSRGNIFNALLHDGDTRSLIENAIGGSGNDSLVGNEAANELYGNEGNDTLGGGTGVDSLYGGANDDVLFPDAPIENGETYAGQAGSDTLNLSGLTEDHVLYLTAGTLASGAAVAAVSSIETVVSGSGADILEGNFQSNRLEGGNGDDTLRGNGGVDTLLGGEGDDNLGFNGGTLSPDNVFDGGAGTDVFDISAFLSVSVVR
ncbi:M10 family metallopeptidase [Pseudooceanicola sp. 502str34]